MGFVQGDLLHMLRSILHLGACKSTHAVLIVVATGARASA